MMRLVFLFVLFLTVGRSVADERPNIVVLFSDDAGYADFGFQPSAKSDMKRLTPHIDSIARDGVRLSSAYMSGAVCSPSRAGLMTGRYQQRFGHDNNIPPGYMKSGLPLSETFGAKRMRTAGYTTGLVGKWHLGYPAAYHPNKRGFDWFYGCLQGSRSY
ncbi:MAG: sulfatase-like hydrolase/transferase, partial [Planctomycetota bacterium]|nr:sulfatase-like hydrolase/transferase [Planctomycetota bacterium]